MAKKRVSKKSKADETQELLEKITILLQSPDEEFINSGLNLFSLMIATEDALYDIFAKGAVCSINADGKLRCKNGNWQSMAILGVLAILAEERQDPYALRIKKIDMRTWKENPTSLPDQIGGLQNLEWFHLGNNYQLKKLPDSICDLQKLSFFDFSTTGIELVSGKVFAQYPPVIREAFFNKALQDENIARIEEYGRACPDVLSPFHHTARVNKQGELHFDFSQQKYSVDVGWYIQWDLFWLLVEHDNVEVDSVYTLFDVESSRAAQLKKLVCLETLGISMQSNFPDVDLSTLQKLSVLIIHNTPESLVLPKSVTTMEFHSFDEDDSKEIVIAGQRYTNLPTALSNLPNLARLDLYNVETFSIPSISEVKQYSTVVKEAFLKMSLEDPKGYDFAMFLFDVFPEELLAVYRYTVQADKSVRWPTLTYATNRKKGRLPPLVEGDLIERVFFRFQKIDCPSTHEIRSIRCSQDNAEDILSGSYVEDGYVHFNGGPLDLSNTNIKSIKIKGERQIKVYPSGHKGVHYPVLNDVHFPSTLIECNIEKVIADASLLEQIPAGITTLNISNISWFDVPDLSRFPHLTTLKLINCNLSTLPSIPKTVRHLYVSKNPFGCVPDSILKHTKLESLYISNCGISELPSLDKLERLQTLSYCNNSIASDNIEKTIGELPNLTELRIGSGLILKGRFPSLRRLFLFDLVWLHTDSFAGRSLDVLDIKDCSSAAAEHAILQLGAVQELRGYAPQGVFPHNSTSGPVISKRESSFPQNNTQQYIIDGSRSSHRTFLDQRGLDYYYQRSKT